MRGGKTKKILIVDYDASTCRVFKQIFQKRGLTVDVAKDGEEAKERIKKCTYDAALISFVLPDMHGIDLLLFTTKNMPNAAKIITTGFPSLSNGIKVIEAGADAYFSKPVKPEELILVVEQKLKLPSMGKPSGATGSTNSTSGSCKRGRNLLNGAC